MANFQPRDMSLLDPATAIQVDLTWQMAKASLAANNQQVLINASVYQLIGNAGLEEIKFRLSQTLGGVPVVAYVDHENEVVRVMQHSGRVTSTTRDINGHNISVTPTNDDSSARLPTPLKPVLRAFGKKYKVPRPPNAFILYRQHWHPHYKQHNKEMHNNDISKELGKRWKSESEDVKEKYKALADDLKAKHTALYPDYQYAPRKPGEKKRRMTARKLEKLREAQHVQQGSQYSSPESSGVSFAGSPGPFVSAGYDIDFTTTPNSINDHEMNAASIISSQPIQFKDNDTFVSTLPSSFDNIQAEIDRECGEYNADYVDVAQTNDSLATSNPEDSSLQASPASSQTDQQNTWESLIDWHGLNNAMVEAEDMVEDEYMDLAAEQACGPDQSHTSYYGFNT